MSWPTVTDQTWQKMEIGVSKINQGCGMKSNVECDIAALDAAVGGLPSCTGGSWKVACGEEGRRKQSLLFCMTPHLSGSCRQAVYSED